MNTPACLKMRRGCDHPGVGIVFAICAATGRCAQTALRAGAFFEGPRSSASLDTTGSPAPAGHPQMAPALVHPKWPWCRRVACGAAERHAVFRAAMENVDEDASRFLPRGRLGPRKGGVANLAQQTNDEEEFAEGFAVPPLQTFFHEKGVAGAHASCQVLGHFDSNAQKIPARPLQTLWRNLPLEQFPEGTRRWPAPEGVCEITKLCEAPPCPAARETSSRRRAQRTP